MDKCLMLAVAGSGKTTYLISRLDLEHRFQIVTYTRNNHKHLCNSVIRKFGYFPENIRVMKYFEFLYSFCFRPYSGLKMRPRGIVFDMPPEYTRYHKDTEAYYRTREGRMYANRIAYYCKEKTANDIKDRLDKYYDYFFIDEVQDIAGHDFNMLLAILPDRCESLFVGDFYQHTFETSNDGKVNSGLYKKYRPYLKRWEDADVRIDSTSLSKTRRCSEKVCEFVRTLGIDIESSGETSGDVMIVDDEAVADEVILNGMIPKLFYDKSDRYKCAGLNWGASKGVDSFTDVCVVLNKTTEDLFVNGRLSDMNPKSKNKLYVACTRAHRHLYIMSYKFLEKYKQ